MSSVPSLRPVSLPAGRQKGPPRGRAFPSKEPYRFFFGFFCSFFIAVPLDITASRQTLHPCKVI
jgi:hypothetical protein